MRVIYIGIFINICGHCMISVYSLRSSFRLQNSSARGDLFIVLICKCVCSKHREISLKVYDHAESLHFFQKFVSLLYKLNQDLQKSYLDDKDGVILVKVNKKLEDIFYCE